MRQNYHRINNFSFMMTGKLMKIMFFNIYRTFLNGTGIQKTVFHFLPVQYVVNVTLS
jgi:hypothetical protein